MKLRRKLIPAAILALTAAAAGLVAGIGFFNLYLFFPGYLLKR